MVKICLCGCGRAIRRENTHSDLSERKYASSACHIRHKRERRHRLASQRNEKPRAGESDGILRDL